MLLMRMDAFSMGSGCHALENLRNLTLKCMLFQFSNRLQYVDIFASGHEVIKLHFFVETDWEARTPNLSMTTIMHHRIY